VCTFLVVKKDAAVSYYCRYSFAEHGLADEKLGDAPAILRDEDPTTTTRFTCTGPLQPADEIVSQNTCSFGWLYNQTAKICQEMFASCGSEHKSGLPTKAKCDATSGAGNQVAGGGDLAYYEHPCGSNDAYIRPCDDGEGTQIVADPTYKTCSSQSIKVGDACNDAGARCVLSPANVCSNTPTQLSSHATYLFCRSAPFEEIGCRKSRREFKENISYVAGADKDRLVRDLLGVKLARYDYKPETGLPAGPQLGAIIDDAPNAAFVSADQQRINLYGYISAVVATVQKQQERIDQLEAELKKLRTANKSQ
jgi:hypothetical protein